MPALKLIGMLDSPYVRRTAISLRMMGLDFELSQLSVFRNFDEFKAINPVVKAPSLVTDDGQMLMDSTLILEYADRLAPDRSLMPVDAAMFVKVQHLIGLAMAANEKTVQLVYEKTQRPGEKFTSLGSIASAASCRAPMAHWRGKRHQVGLAGASPIKPISRSRWPGASPRAGSRMWWPPARIPNWRPIRSAPRSCPPSPR